MMFKPKLEIIYKEERIPVTDVGAWRAWVGPRFIGGVEFHGPVHILDTEDLWKGQRHCGCKECQQHVAPQFKFN